MDCAPRVTIQLIDGVPQVDSLDYSGIKSIKIMSEKTREVLYSYEAQRNLDYSSYNNSIKTTEKDGIKYLFRVQGELDMKKMEKAKVGKGKYKIRVVAEDKSGIKNEKVMITHISLK